jgi:two-component system, response regulator FlrC
MRLLIIGQLSGQLALASKMAMEAGARVVHAGDLNTAYEQLRNRGADLIMIDVAADIATFITQIRSELIQTDVVACGIGTNARAAVDAIRAGAKEYVPLPPEAELIAAVIQAVAMDDHPLIFRDPAMTRVIGLADQVANSEASILITGESGTGKEVMARHIHRKSQRADKPFIAVNCAAIPESLLESELFGHEKGAFSGAIARRIGKFEEADGGTLLLDEISEMDIRLQAKLLRAIQERQIDRVGGSKPVPVNIRIIATSNRNLSEAVRKRTFREDLLFRLNVVNVKLPPLRERPVDVRALADYFARKFADMNSLPVRMLDEESIAALLQHPWPGNVRELENTLHRAVLLANGPMLDRAAIVLSNDSEDRDDHAATQVVTENGTSSAAVGRTLADVERDHIMGTLKACLGNRTHAAKILDISIRTLRNKLHEYQALGVTVPTPGASERLAS